MGTTTNYGWEYPDNGGDVDTWGGIHTTMVQAIDARVKTNADLVTTNYLARAGGTMTGDIILPILGSSSAAVAGFKGAPQNAVAADYTFVLSDQGRSVVHTSGSAHAWTIPPNSSVAAPVGTVIVLLNIPTGGVITLTRGAGVELYLGGVATNANRSLAAAAMASLIKFDTDKWFVQGSGVA
jgi:hypothetical protein